MQETAGNCGDIRAEERRGDFLRAAQQTLVPRRLAPIRIANRHFPVRIIIDPFYDSCEL